MAVAQAPRAESTAAPYMVAPAPMKKPRKQRDHPLLLVLLILLAGAFSFPFIWLLLASLKPAEEVFNGQLLPEQWSLDNYRQVFRQVPIWRWMLNTLIVCVLGVVSVVLSSSLVAYAFARLRFPGRSLFFALVIGTFSCPDR